jgi:hypothetical protein
VSWYVVVVASVVVTAVPDVAVGGATSPAARRMMTPVNPSLVGSVHDNVIVVEDSAVTCTLLTGKGVAADAASIGNRNEATIVTHAAKASARNRCESARRPRHPTKAIIEPSQRRAGLFIWAAPVGDRAMRPAARTLAR